jgi:hypothetical protein
MLFCPPLPPVRIEPGSSAVIGRHPNCEFSLRQSDVSRRHAEVRAEGSGFALFDLGSTNGTLLNGEAVREPTPLAAGDRIEIGANTITFCWLDATLDEATMLPEEAKTMISEPALARDAFHGELAEIPSFAVLQVLEMGMKTGTFEVHGPSGRGRVWFERGRPVHAETEKHIGFDAAVQVVNTTNGEFRFEAGPLDTNQTIRASVTELLLEASRLQNEAREAGSTDGLGL